MGEERVWGPRESWCEGRGAWDRRAPPGSHPAVRLQGTVGGMPSVKSQEIGSGHALATLLHCTQGGASPVGRAGTSGRGSRKPRYPIPAGGSHLPRCGGRA